MKTHTRNHDADTQIYECWLDNRGQITRTEVRAQDLDEAATMLTIATRGGSTIPLLDTLTEAR